MLPRKANLNRGASAKECSVLFSIVQYSVPSSIVVSSSIRSFQVQLPDSFKRCQSVIRNDIKELGIQVLSDRQFAHGIAVGITDALNPGGIVAPHCFGEYVSSFCPSRGFFGFSYQAVSRGIAFL